MFVFKGIVGILPVFGVVLALSCGFSPRFGQKIDYFVKNIGKYLVAFLSNIFLGIRIFMFRFGKQIIIFFFVFHGLTLFLASDMFLKVSILYDSFVEVGIIQESTNKIQLSSFIFKNFFGNPFNTIIDFIQFLFTGYLPFIENITLLEGFLTAIGISVLMGVYLKVEDRNALQSIKKQTKQKYLEEYENDKENN